MAKFIILALPRSRTKWVSEWLSFNGRYTIGHDLAVDCSSVLDFEDSLEAVDGTVETGAVLGWRLLREYYPDLRIATISRPVQQVVASLDAFGLGQANKNDMFARAEMLTALAQQPGVENFTFEGLSREAECARLWEFCLGRDFDFLHWVEMKDQNIQIDMKERISRIVANSQGLELLQADLIAEINKIGNTGSSVLN